LPFQERVTGLHSAARTPWTPVSPATLPSPPERGPAWLHTPEARQALDAARQLVQGVVPRATFAERERLILVLLRELACQTLESELNALDASLPPRLQSVGVIFQRGRARERTLHSPVGPLHVRPSLYHPLGGTSRDAYEPLGAAAGCMGHFTPALVELVQNGVSAIDHVPEAIQVELRPPPPPAPEPAPVSLRVVPPPAEPEASTEGRSRASDADAVVGRPEPKGRAARTKIPASSRRERSALATFLARRAEPPPVRRVVRLDEPWWDEPHFVELDADDRRQHPRARVELAIEFGSNHEFYRGLTADMSTGGLFVATHASRPIGEEVEFSVQLPGRADPVRGLAKVRWVREYNEQSDVPPGMGLEFVSLEPRDLACVSEYVASHQPLFWEP
jgi:type IV pilus assembly protein PilZ